MNRLNKVKILIICTITVAILLGIGSFLIYEKNNNFILTKTDANLETNDNNDIFKDDNKANNTDNNDENFYRNKDEENDRLDTLESDKKDKDVSLKSLENNKKDSTETIDNKADDGTKARLIDKKSIASIFEKKIAENRKIILNNDLKSIINNTNIYQEDNYTDNTNTYQENSNTNNTNTYQENSNINNTNTFQESSNTNNTNKYQENSDNNNIQVNESATKYKVIYRTNGGSAVSTVYVKENEKAFRPEQNPTKDNATFIDWYTDKTLNTLYDFNTPVTKNTILYAGWKTNIDLSIVSAVNNFKLKNTKINKNEHAITVIFTSSSMNIISMDSALRGLFKDASNSDNYKSVYISYNGRGFDYLNYSDKLVPLRFIGWFGKGIWSGSYGFDCKSGDFIGKSFNIHIKLKDGYLSENNNVTEDYQVSFGNG